MNSTRNPISKRPIFKMRAIESRLYYPIRGTSSSTQVGSKRVIIDLTGDDSEDDIERITQVSSRQSAGARVTRRLALVEQEMTVDNLIGGVEEHSGSVDSEMTLGYTPVEGCLRAQLQALALQLQQPSAAEGQQGTPTVRTIRLTSSEAMRKRWGENGNPNDYLIVKVRASQRTSSFEIAALRKHHLTSVTEVFADTQAEVRRLQTRLSKQIEEAALRMEIAKTAREREEANRIKKMEKARKAKQLKQEKTAQGPKEAHDRVKEMGRASKATQTNQEKLTVENKRAKKF